MLGSLDCFLVYVVCDREARGTHTQGCAAAVESAAMPAVTYPLSHFKRVLSEFAFENV